jgi:hypothetical protein
VEVVCGEASEYVNRIENDASGVVESIRAEPQDGSHSIVGTVQATFNRKR